MRACIDSCGDIPPDDAQYAFYLLADARKVAVRWYTRENAAAFDIPETALNAALTVRGFVRARNDHDNKRSLLVTVEADPGNDTARQ